MEKELWKGNEAVAEAAIRAGCKYFFGYPITPQNEIPEYLSLHLPKIGGCFLQAESEVAAINMIYGAAGGIRGGCHQHDLRRCRLRRACYDIFFLSRNFPEAGRHHLYVRR